MCEREITNSKHGQKNERRENAVTQRFHRGCAMNLVSGTCKPFFKFQMSTLQLQRAHYC